MYSDIPSCKSSLRIFGSEAELDEWIHHCVRARKSAFPDKPVFFLDSQLRGHPSSGKGFLAWGQRAVLLIEAGSKSRDAWQELDRFRREHPDWMFGWLAYDLKNCTEALDSDNEDPIGLPDLFFFVPETVIRIDRKMFSAAALRGRLPSFGFSAVSDNGKDALKTSPSSGLNPGPSSGLNPNSSCGFQLSPLISSDGWDQYRDKVLKIKHYIKLGDTYEVNLTHQLRSDFKGDTLSLFNAMRLAGPVPFAAWIHCAGVEICCASPERFLQRSGHRIRSQPIKGTSPRGKNEADDRRVVREILKKEKNRAENVMIVDLVRNDLSRIAQSGTVKAEEIFQVQTFSTLHQLVSEVEASIRPGISSVEAIRVCFPMGSMTGAPKIRTMQIIEELESYRRGLYSGAIGYFTPGDDFDFNVVIRSAICKGSRLYYSVGGAITSDSDPAEEWEESWLKAETLQKAVAHAMYRSGNLRLEDDAKKV